MTRLLWWLGVTWSPSRRLMDGHGYSRLGCMWRRRPYTTPADVSREIGRQFGEGITQGLRTRQELERD